MLISILSSSVSSSLATRLSALKALRILAHNHLASKDAIREAGGLTTLLSLLGNQSSTPQQPEILVSCLATLSKVIFDNPRNSDEVGRLGGVEIIVPLLSSSATEIRAKAVYVMSLLTFGSSSIEDRVREVGGIPLLVALLSDDVSRIKTGASDALANLSYDNATNRDAIRLAGAFDPFMDMLSEEAFKQCAVNCFANLIVDNVANQVALYDAGGYFPYEVLLSDVSEEVRETALQALSTLGTAVNLAALENSR